MFRKKILLVETDTANNEVILLELGYDVLTACSGKEAINLARLMSNISLILIDTHLDDEIDAVETAKQILAYHDIPIVFIVSQTDKALATKIKEVSRFGLVPKGSGNFVLQSTIEMAFELHEAKLKIATTSERNQKLLNHLAAGVVVHGPDTSIVYNNERASELLGLDNDQMRGKRALDPFWKFVDSEGNDLAYEDFPVNQIIKTGEPINNKTLGVIHQEDHEITWLRVNGIPIRKNHNLIEVIISFMDVTEQVNLIKALEVSEGRYKHLFCNNPQAMWIYDVDSFKFLEVNQAAVDQYGYEENEFLNMTVKDVLSSEDRAKLDNTCKGLLEPSTSEWDHIKKNGEIINVSVKSHSIDHYDKNARLCLVNDITLIKNKEHLIRESEQFAYGSLNALSTQIAILDERGIIMAVNDAWKNFARENSFLLEYDYHVNSNYLEACRSAKGNGSEEAMGMYDGLLSVINNDIPYFSLEYPCHSPEEKRWFQVQVTRFYIGDKLRIVVSHENISKRIKNEMKMKELLQEKEIVLHEVHHRIKNNVNMVSGLLQVQALSSSDQLVANELNDAVARLKSMGHVYDQLFKSESFDEIPVKNYLIALIAEMEGIFKAYQVQINKTIEDFMLSSKDLTALGIIVNELITNGIKHAFPERKEGLINLNLKRSNGSVILIYEDNGVGISQTSDSSNSFGLKLIELLTGQLNGKHKIQSINGTQFLIEFPYNLN